MLEEETFAKVSRKVFDGIVDEAIMSADSAAIRAAELGGTAAAQMRAGVRAAFAFAVAYGLVEMKPPSGEPRWYRIEIGPDDVCTDEEER